jgi:adenosine deaminase
MKIDNKLTQFILGVPKAELHLHIEGTLEPELVFVIARRNNLSLPFKSPEQLRKAYNFNNLQSFLDLYYAVSRVLRREEDFYDLTMAYLRRAYLETVRHTEMFFDPQAHTQRGIPFKTVIKGIGNASIDAEKEFGISTKLIMCFLRDLSAESAMETLEQALIFKDSIIGVGLDSSELGNPPEKFKDVFDNAREQGFLTVAHAGEEGPPEYIWQALKTLKVSRIDHGVRCIEDPELVEKIESERIPLTVCPISNVKLGIFNTIREHNLKKLLDLGLCVTVNSDDPGYFGGYIFENYKAVAEALNLDKNDLYQIAKNSFDASFLTQEEKQKFLAELDNYMSEYED